MPDTNTVFPGGMFPAELLHRGKYRMVATSWHQRATPFIIAEGVIFLGQFANFSNLSNSKHGLGVSYVLVHD